MDKRNYLEYRNPGLVLVFAIITCGVYLIFWYYKVYEEMRNLTGKTPTGLDYFLDLMIMLITCGLWAIYVDYMISVRLKEINQAAGRQSDTTVLVLILDAAAYFNLLTFAISSAIQQDELNKLREMDGELFEKATSAVAARSRPGGGTAQGPGALPQTLPPGSSGSNPYT